MRVGSGQLLASACGAAVLALTAAGLPAEAAAPRDAIAALPGMTFTSDVTINEATSPNSQTYEDFYQGTWQFDWVPPRVDLYGSGSLRLEFHHWKRLTDKLVRHEGFSDDRSSDQTQVFVSAEQLGPVSMSYRMDRTDSYSGRNPSLSERAWTPADARSFQFSISPEDLPSLTGGYISAPAFNPASDRELAQYSVQFARADARHSESYTASKESERTRNYASGLQSSYQRGRFQGYRQLPLGSLGQLSMAYDYFEEDSLLAVSGERTTHRDNVGIVTVEGDVQAFPLHYRLNLTNLDSDTAARLPSFYQRTETRLDLGFRPAIAKDRVLGVQGALQNSQERSADFRRSSQLQEIMWLYTPKSGTSFRIGYNQQAATDEVTQLPTTKSENINGNITYSIPGSPAFGPRGTISADLLQSVDTRGLGDSSSTTKSVNIINGLRLGDAADVQFRYMQIYSDSENRFFEFQSRDTLMTGVTYRFHPDRRFNFESTWNYSLSSAPGVQKNDTDEFLVNLTYRPLDNWTYIFRVNGRDAGQTMFLDAAGDSYRSTNSVQAIVIYSF